MEQRDWLYLLPDNRTADNKREACEMLGAENRPITSERFRRLVKCEVIKKVNRINYSIISQGDASNKKNLHPTI